MDYSPVIAAGGSVGLFVAVAGLLFRLLVLQGRKDRQTEHDIEELKAENVWCNRRVSVLILACQQGGIVIPSEVWNGPPQVFRDARRPGARRDRDVGDRRDRQRAGRELNDEET